MKRNKKRILLSEKIIYMICKSIINNLKKTTNHIKKNINKKNIEKKRIRKLWEESKQYQNNSPTLETYEQPKQYIPNTPRILLDKKNKLLNIKQPKDYYFIGVKKEYIIVKEEMEFYLNLKKITDKYGFTIFPFMRLADIIRTRDDSLEFNKICRRHIDFTIVDKHTKPLLYIELDGASHNKWKQKIRDEKKDYIFKTINETIYRVNISEMYEKLIDIEEYLRYIYIKNINYKINKNYN